MLLFFLLPRTINDHRDGQRETHIIAFYFGGVEYEKRGDDRKARYKGRGEVYDMRLSHEEDGGVYPSGGLDPKSSCNFCEKKM